MKCNPFSSNFVMWMLRGRNTGTPFWHLNYEPFWRLVPFCGGEETLAQLKKSNPYSPGSIRKNIRYAEIDIELFELMRDEDCRTELRKAVVLELRV